MDDAKIDDDAAAYSGMFNKTCVSERRLCDIYIGISSTISLISIGRSLRISVTKQKVSIGVIVKFPF